ncbi:MAG TPA: ABC transporter ATP-binding protein [Steroidobacteraceae bacterium]|nr:ABC transporter ATP-binding protein [Steroidobacteraceae bacterium]
MPAAIEFRNVARQFGTVRAVDDVSLAIAAGEFFALLGPSGSGKTTCLRLIAGFEHPTAGQVLLNGADVTDVPPYERNVNTVFQDYALFPHMSVAENVAYGLRVRKVAPEERQARAREMLALVQLEGLGERSPAQLSGGQKQRVALARALINHPAVLLLDEPLGALDLKLREAMQIELKNLQRKLAITFVYVTHDQGEALSMADRIAVFDRGRIEQLDTPRGLYMRPRTSFVARFVGGANVIEGELARRLSGNARPFAIRAEMMSLDGTQGAPGNERVGCEATVIDVHYHGASSRWQLRTADGTVLAVMRPESGVGDQPYPVGSKVNVSWSRVHMVMLESPP